MIVYTAAFPALGSSKIVWAVEMLGAKASRHETKPANEIPQGQITHCEADGRDLFIYREQDGA